VSGPGAAAPAGRRVARLPGRTALVTGSARGIGRGIARRLARDGALVAVHYATNRAAAADTVALIERDGGRAFAVGAELGAPGAVDELFDAVERGLKDHTGAATLSVLVNNAARSGPGTAPEDVTAELLDEYYRVNATAPFLLVQRALPLLPEGGRIVNISSGLTRSAHPDQVAYAMSKGALEQVTLHLARHLAGRGITVNTVAPGRTDNGGPAFADPAAVAAMAGISAFNRVGEAADIADVVAFLASPDARWITGAFIDATGGSLLG
jgi:NAD(P)-dependent dehydrogenase (short-subunit alcohol dehydrogenase family)